MAMQDEKKKELIRTIKFVGFSISAGAIEIIVDTVLNALHIFKPFDAFGAHIEAASITYFIAYICSVVWNFTFNRKFTFKSANNIPKAMMQVFLYSIVFLIFSTAFNNYLVGKGWNETVALIVNMLINFVTEYLYQRFFVFRDSIDTNDIAQKEREKANNVK